MRGKAVLLAVVTFAVATAACGTPAANRVVIVDAKNGSFTVTGAATVTFGFTAGVFQPALCDDMNVFVFRSDAAACGVAGKAGHAYQVQKDTKLKDVGTVDLNKTDSEIAGMFGIKNSEPLEKISFPYPLVL